MKTHYDLLGVAQNADAETIKSAYRALLKQYHPDLAEDKQTAHAMTQALIAAYEVLSDAEKRATYDASLKPKAAVVIHEEKTPPPTRNFAPIGLDFSWNSILIKLIIGFLILYLCAMLLIAIGQ